MISIALRLNAISHSISITLTQFFLSVFTLRLVYDLFRKRYNLFDCPYFKYYLLLLITGFLSVLFGLNPEQSLLKFFKYEWLILYFFIGYFYIPQELRENVFKYLIIGGLVASTYGFYQYFFKNYPRVEGFFSHALTFGNVMSLLSILSFSLILTRAYKTNREKFFLIFSFICFFLSVYFSGGRGPLIYTLITICIIFAITYGKRGTLLGIVLLSIFTLSAYMFHDTIFNRFRFYELQDLSNSMSSVGTRIALWIASYKIFLNYPIFGIGYGNFSQVVQQYLNVPVDTTAHAHNAYIQHLVAHGIVGFFALIWFFYKLIKKFILSLKANPIALVGISLLINYLLQGLTEDNFRDSEVAMLFWFTIGSIIGIIDSKK